jgi:hypothetical protein
MQNNKVDVPKIWKCSHCMMEVDQKATRCPHCHGKIRRGTSVWTWLVAAIVFMFIFSYITAQLDTPSVPVDSEPPITTTSFDIPSLLNLNITQIEEKLGEPSTALEPTKAQLEAGITTWEKSFEKDGHSLLVTYEYSTGKIVDFFINPRTSSGVTNDLSGLLVLGNFKKNDPTYDVKFVPAHDGSGFTGAIVTPK